jgi:hypothetical protein
MEEKKLSIYNDEQRPSAPASVGVFFINLESPGGSIFLP